VSVEDLLRDTLHGADRYAPSPDLFERVQRSIEEDGAHRRRIRLAAAAVVTGGALVAVYLSALAERVDGRVTWPWWSLELLTTTLLVILVLVLGPLIRRFGRIYAAAVFAAHPPTARRFLTLLDIAYYLVFCAYLLIETRIEPELAWLRPDGLAQHATHLTERVAGMLLLMGLLHSITIVTLPVIGVVFADSWRRRPHHPRR
jgi:hypothetical protein